MSLETSALLLSWLVILMLALAMAGVIRQLRIVSMAVGGMAVSPSASLEGLRLPEDLRRAMNGMAAGATLIFMDSACQSCASILPQVQQSSREDGNRRLKIVFRGSAPDWVAGEPQVFDQMGTAFEALQIPATPFAVDIDEAGGVARAAPVGSEQAFVDFMANGPKERTAA